MAGIKGIFNNTKEWLREQGASQQDHLFLWSPVFMGLGIGLYFQLSVEPPVILGLMIVAVSFGVLAALWPHRKSERKHLWLLAMVVFLVGLGFAVSSVRTALVYTPMLAKEIRVTELTGTVQSIEDMGAEAGSRVVLSDLVVEDLRPEETPRYVRLRLRNDEGILPGQRIKALAGLNPPSPPVAPGAFDFQRHSYFLGIGAVGFIYKRPEIIEGRARLGEGFLETLRLRISAAIEKGMENKQAAAIAQALIVGKRKAISEADEEAFRDSGLTHLLSISGLHIGLASGVIFFFMRLVMAAFPGFALRHPIKKYAAGAAFLGALGYTILIGAPVTAQRSVLMIGIVLLAIMLDRWPFSLRLVAFAALGVLLFAPESLTNAGFQMSFAAVACLIAVYEWQQPLLSRVYRGAGPWRKIALYFLGICATSIIAEIATAPFVLFHFQRFALYGLLGNFVAVPVTAFVIMPMAVLALLLMPFGLEFAPLYIMEQGIAGILDVAYWVAGLPGSTWQVTAWPKAAFVTTIAAGLILILWRGPLKLAALPLLIAAVVVIILYRQPDVLVGSGGDLVAFRADRDLYVSAKNKERFVLQNWERMLGVPEGGAIRWPAEGRLKDGPQDFICDEFGCRLTINGKKISFAREPSSHGEDCDWANILISPDPVKDEGCGAGIVIDKWNRRDNGAYAIWLNDSGNIKVQSANGLRGNRPWVAKEAERR
ncbi:MAG TPA: competence protein ComEC [Rhodospirillaceae bacterium]|nr:competence protein ComEC [Rhodospirillaceae bacterium]